MTSYNIVIRESYLYMPHIKEEDVFYLYKKSPPTWEGFIFTF